MPYSNIDSAISSASKKAKKLEKELYIFEEDDEYHIANEEDCETFFAGVDPLLTCSCDGFVHWNK